ncbi:hypothetical protein NWUPM3A1_155 [Escherichia phage vB_EcoM_3A1_SA_NWU]|uniref:hypothetical protein n=1 Tax=Escherichia coli TaxID=562 RepID=UPI0018A352CB|nr:hypothetical protein [Escherichia coli]WAX24756.1 hypothetical protein [Escherichia phage vB_EcoM_DE16]WCD43336.1 hypothetical protein ECML183-2_000015 [Escherichia phage ECML-183-2]WIL78215.1 hypothetical protein NWUPM3A1_155 [Escherichia phage vB_EcoM_3A1_SA_NWU]WIL78702.1 hypothetical protein NWUPM10C3_156 [Escherichia phage vB_EcoM_10C3_SA_NWU]WIL79458.1 hypothetical protein NWUPM118_156 [Escherichia phage vB_EcoM_118_SA_NWU]CAA7332711.1 Hypothetical protein MEKHABCG_00154 [Escherichia
MRKFLIGMFCTYPNNKISSTKVWNALGMLTMTGMFIFLGIEKEIPEWMGWAFVFMITPSRLMKNLIDLRWGRSQSTKEDD